MRKLIVSVLIFTLLVGVCGAAWCYWTLRLPAPSACTDEQLYRWLALRDMSVESPETQLALIDRFEEILVAESDERPAEIPSSYQRQVDDNSRLLRSVWFNQRVSDFHQLPADERDAFLDRQITAISRWTELQSSGDETVSIGDVIREETVDFDDQQRRAAREAVRAAVLRWLCTRSVEPYSMDKLASIADEIVQEMTDDSSSQESLDRLTVDERNRLQSNGMLLLQAWFHQQAQQFDLIASDARAQFLQERIDQLRQLPLEKVFSEDGVPANALSSKLRMLETVQRWIQQADESQHERLRAFANAIQRHMLMSALQMPKPQ